MEVWYKRCTPRHLEKEVVTPLDPPRNAADGPEGQTDVSVWLEHVSEDVSRLRLSGTLPSRWAGALALGLSREQVTILRGCACRVSPRGWTAFFDLHGLEGKAALQAIDFRTLATRWSAHATPAPIELESYTLTPMPGGWLQLGVRGRDCVGFLGNLLDRLEGLSLFPEEMQIQTHGRVAEDRFQIRGAAGRPVSDDAREDLRALLDLWVRDPRPPRR